MRQKIIATGAALVLVSLAAVGTFASQDGASLLEEPTVEPTSTETTESTPTATEESTNTPDPTATTEPTTTSDATETPDGTATPEGEDDDDIHGIPADNPNHVDDDGDGICEKGEAAIKTTPSGVQVRVPCHAADKSDHPENGNKHSDDDEEGDDDEDADGDEEEGDDLEEEADPE